MSKHIKGRKLLKSLNNNVYNAINDICFFKEVFDQDSQDEYGSYYSSHNLN